MFMGSGVALVTPMKDEKVNFDKISELIEYQIANGTGAIIICGTTGEASTLSHEEHLQCIKVAIDASQKRIPVIAGTGKNDTRACASISQEAERAGADGLLLVTPYYNKTTQKGLIEHYRVITSTVSIPVIVYNVPSRTGLRIEPETMARLCELPNIQGLKEAGSDIVKTAEIVRLCGTKIILYSGNDNETVPILALGGKGVISVVANIAPRDMSNMVHFYLNGDYSGALSLQLSTLPITAALFSEVNPIPVKAAMNLLGFDVGSPRLPLIEMTGPPLDRLKMAMHAYGFKLRDL